MTLGRDFRIEGLTLEVEAGERVSILGPNGSGKSSTLRAIAGLEVPRSGTITLAGELLSSGGRVHRPPDCRGMGILFQDGVLFPHLDVRQNVELGLPPGTAREQGSEPVDRALSLARVEHLEHRQVTVLSGGEQQRVALARALVQRPKVLLLDEPFQGLDGPTTREIIDEVRKIVVEESIVTVHVTHDAEEAATFSDRIVLLVDGRKMQEGSFEEIYEHPFDTAAASFLGPLGSIEVERARQNGIEVPNAVDGLIYFRPEHLLLEKTEGTEGLVVSREWSSGALQEVVVALDDGSELASRRLAEEPLRPGQKVTARIARELTFRDEDRKSR